MTIDKNQIKFSRNKPHTPSRNLEDLLSQSYCCVWKYDLEDNGNYAKKPRSPNPKPNFEYRTFHWSRAWKRSIEEGRWGTGSEVLRSWQKSRSLPDDQKMQGIGLIVEPSRKKTLRSAGRPVYIVCGDLDGCVDFDTGHIAQWAMTIVFDAATYTEFSPSDGLRLFGYTTEPINASKKFYTLDGRTFLKEKDLKGDKEEYNRVEVYGGGYGGKRHISFTGFALDDFMYGFDVPLNDLTEWMTGLPTRGSGEEQERVFNSDRTRSRPSPVVANPQKASDEEVLRIIARSKHQSLMDRFMVGDESLWGGENRVYRSRSEADHALISILYYFCQGREEQVKRIAKQTKMKRRRWDTSYFEDSFADVVGFCNEVTGYYNPSSYNDHVLEIVEHLFEQRMDQRLGANANSFLFSLLTLGICNGEYEVRDGKEGFSVDAAVRDINLISKIAGSNSHNLTEVSKAKNELKTYGLREIRNGGSTGGKKSSRYFIPRNLLNHNTYITDKNTHTYAHSCVLGAGEINLLLYKDKRERIIGLGDSSPYHLLDTVNELPKEDEIKGKPLAFYLKLMWLPNVSKEQRFVLEQILYGRNTLEALHTYFEPKDKSYFKNKKLGNIKHLLIEEDIDGEALFKLSVDAIDRQFEDGGRQDLLRYLETVDKERTQYHQSRDKFSHLKTVRQLLSYYRGQIHFRDLSEWEQNKTWDYKMWARQDNTTPIALLEKEITNLEVKATQSEGE